MCSLSEAYPSREELAVETSRSLFNVLQSCNESSSQYSSVRDLRTGWSRERAIECSVLGHYSAGKETDFLTNMVKSYAMEEMMFGYRLLYLLLHPWIIVKESFNQIKWAWQRVFRGWDDRASWNINDHILKIVPEMIERMRDYDNSYPSSIGQDEWHNILDKISDGFKAGYKLSNSDQEVFNELWDSGWNGGDFPDGFMERLKEESIELNDKFDAGMALFVKWFWSLWD